MKVHPLIAGAVITAILSLQGWTLLKLTDLDVKVAALTQRLDDEKKSATMFKYEPYTGPAFAVWSNNFVSVQTINPKIP